MVEAVKNTNSKSMNELGNGLQDLLSNVIGIESNKNEDITNLEINKIVANKNQPRINFNEEEMLSMIASINENGILQPILVRPENGNYEIVAGERRWRAAKEVGLKMVPVIIKKITKDKSLELALIENLQREDLNPIEKAKSYDRLLKNHQLTQDEVAKKLSINRSSVANVIRLLELPGDIQGSVSRGTVSMGHARALLAVKNETLQRKIFKRIETEGLSVRQIENITSHVKKSLSPEKKHTLLKRNTPLISDVEDKLRNILKTKVSLNEKDGKGKITIEFYDNNQLENILRLLGVSFGS